MRKENTLSFGIRVSDAPMFVREGLLCALEVWIGLAVSTKERMPVAISFPASLVKYFLGVQSDAL